MSDDPGHYEPCMCGHTPRMLRFHDYQPQEKWMIAGCPGCGESRFEFLACDDHHHPEDLREAARIAWNDLPRG